MTRKDLWRVLPVCLALGLGVIGLYAPAFTFGFISYDDPLYVVNNPHINHGLAQAFGWAFASGYGHAWQPLAWLSHAMDCQMFGLKPAGHHAVNVILHALNSVLVFLVLRQLTGAFWRSAAVAAFFAWHPLHVEDAAWISERKELLSAFFWLLTVWAYALYVKSRQAQSSTSWRYYAGAVVLFVLTLLCGPVGVTLPIILLLLDWWPLGRLAATPEQPASKRARFLLVEKIPFVALSIVTCIVSAIAIRRDQLADPMAGLPFRIRFVTAGMSFFHYLWKSVWPADLGTPYPFVLHVPKLELIGAALVLIAITAAVGWAWKTRPYGLAGWFWFLAALLPVVNLFQSGAQPMADRYMYIPSIGLWMLICWAAYDVAGLAHAGRVALGGLCAVLLAACCVLCWIQLGTWRDDSTLLARIPDSGSNAFGHAQYANFLLRQGKPNEAHAECQQAIDITPDNAKFAALMGDILLEQRKVDEAVKEFQSALGMDHNCEIARFGLGRAFVAQRRVPDAAAEFKAIILDDPNNFDAHNWLARIDIAQNKPAAAADEFRLSLKTEINQPTTLNDLAWLLSTDPHPEIRKGDEAVKLAQRACTLTQGREPRFIGTLAAAFAETGDFDRAVTAGKRAYDLALKQGRKDLADTNSELEALYRARKPFHQQP
ncbi:MAG TPA: tetratricopeptide repeat protein [Verrucomicrobiae bacterium]|jgi:tetratricopeptide (TPR) repeat protein